MPTLSDPLGLHTTDVLDLPLAGAAGDIPALVHPKAPFALAGSRHSQGGQTVAAGARILLTEPMSRLVSLIRDEAGGVRSAQVEAGMTWNALHTHLAPLGCAPLVQQSSAHFTIGGSISVNCHGRDPRQGPLATCIQSMEVYLPSQSLTVTTRPGEDLFKAVVGGHGSAGVILTATLRVGPNQRLRQWCRKVGLKAYAQELLDRQARATWPPLNHGWLSFDPDRFWEEVLVLDCTPVPESTQPVKQLAHGLRQDSWASVEFMRAIWEQHQNKPAGRAATWRFLCQHFLRQNSDNSAQGPEKTTTDWLRQPIGFTAHRSEDSVDLLQEYFVPLNQFEPFTQTLAALLKAHGVNVLSSTVRVVQADGLAAEGQLPLTFLSYAPTQAMACVALDFECPVARNTRGELMPKPAVTTWVQQAIDLALHHGGRHYLPYFGFAGQAQFQQAYPFWKQQQALRDPRLDNVFLQTYLSQGVSPDQVQA